MVAVSEWKTEVAFASMTGLGRGGGNENTLDALNRAPPGDMLREAIAPVMVLFEAIPTFSEMVDVESMHHV